MNNNVREKFKTIREKLNISQAQLSQFLDVDQSVISRFENGTRSISMSNLENACTLFGVSLNELLSDKSDVEIIAPSFRKSDMLVSSLQHIKEINKIAINLLEMNQILGKHYE